MFFIYALLALAVVTAAIFAAPLRAKVWTALGFTAANAVASLWIAAGVLADGRTVPLWNVATLMGRDSGSMDPLSALFAAVIAIGSVAATLYARGYLEHCLDRKSPAHVALHYVALVTMSVSMTGVVCSDGGFSFLFFWELMTVASFLLILFDAERHEVRRAALTYLIMMHIGFVLLVVGFTRLHAVAGSASFDALGAAFGGDGGFALFVVFLAGFGMKAGLFPLHVWLPEAHPAAPSHVSALMSGVMIKTGIYGILRTTLAIDEAQMLHTAGLVLLAAGIVTGLWGVIFAAAQNDVKRLLAYSSIENIGVILIGTGIGALGCASGNPVVQMWGFAGALLHTVGHSFFKTLLFFGAGNIRSQVHTTSLDALGGLGRYMPLTSALFLIGSAAICALPPLNGFVSELMIYSGLLRNIASDTDTLVSMAALAALALIGGIVLLAFVKLYGTVFLGSPRSHEVAEAQEADGVRIAAMAIPTAGILLVGLFPHYALRIVTAACDGQLYLPGQLIEELYVRQFADVSRFAWIVILVIALLVLWRRRLLRGRRIEAGPTWGCGFTATNVRMQYTGESFSEGLEEIATSLTQRRREGGAVPKSEIFPRAHDFDIRHKDRIGRLLAAWWLELLRVMNQRVMRLRTGKINHYVLFALAFLVLVALLSIFNLIR